MCRMRDAKRMAEKVREALRREGLLVPFRFEAGTRRKIKPRLVIGSRTLGIHGGSQNHERLLIAQALREARRLEAGL